MSKAMSKTKLRHTEPQGTSYQKSAPAGPLFFSAGSENPPLRALQLGYQLCILVLKGLAVERHKITGTLSLSWSLLLMLSISADAMRDDHPGVFLYTAVLLTTMICVSWFLMKIFSNLQDGGAYNDLRVLPVTPRVLFLSYTAITVIFSLSALITNGALGIWLSGGVTGVGGWEVVGAVMIAQAALILGLAPLGVMCSLITANTRRESYVFPLLFYPLALPLAIASLLSPGLPSRALITTPDSSSSGALIWMMALFYFLVCTTLSSLAHE